MKISGRGRTTYFVAAESFVGYVPAICSFTYGVKFFSGYAVFIP